LARAGNKVTIFDEHLAWEKPCGGGLTHKAIECFPFLLENNYPKKLVREIELISSEEHKASLEMTHPIVIYSRMVLNGMLLDRARAAGCEVKHSHVFNVDTAHSKPRFCVDGEWRETDFVVLAAGARNQLVPETRALLKDELEITQGYFVPQTADAITIKFLPHFEGYIWSFPRCDHLSVGICGSMATHTSTELRGHLKTFVDKHRISTENAKFYSHVLPSPQEHTLSKRTVLGKNWALIGDAAALVDPLTGEGLFYAIRSGELLGRALAQGCPEKYPAWIRASFSAELEFASRIVRRFYRGTILGTSIPSRMVQLMRKSPVFRQLVGDLFSGNQDYTSLKRRIWGHLGMNVSEFISNVLNIEAPVAVPSRGETGAD
jgi:geranylgeranyl diphosphate/geranylgeranyl-bacteriochlorophyllide a reductase